MTKLTELATLVRSKNAGPFLLTLDVVFRSRASYDAVVKSGVLSATSVAKMYRVAVEDVQFYLCPEINAMKATLPRTVGSGDPLDTDVYGAQQVGPLMNLDIPV
jgi:hypothetical protein